MEIQHPDARRGYDLWADTYSATPNPVVSLDQRVTPDFVQPRRHERILDAGCGTGRYFALLDHAGCRVVGFDFSLGMLREARRDHPGVPLVLGDLQRPWPFAAHSFDAVLCALVGEHLADLQLVLSEMWRVMADDGRAVFSVYHPAMAGAGKEAHFRKGAVEYRLGAVRHTLDDYRTAFGRAGFGPLSVHEFLGDEDLARQVPEWQKYLGFPVLLVIQASKAPATSPPQA